MSTSTSLFRFIQVEFPWALGPPDGRYLVRDQHDPEGAPTHVIVFATLGAPERRRLSGLRRPRAAEPSPEPTPVTTGRATVIDSRAPLDSEGAARAWLTSAGEDELTAGVAVLNRALHAFRLISADPYAHPVARRQAIVARVGFGAGEEVADGLWTDARELELSENRGQRRSRTLGPQAGMAAVLGAREPSLACAELTLRARLDLDHGREREAALQLLVALDAALAELSVDPHADELAPRLEELRGQREAVAAAAQAALGGHLEETERHAVSFTLGRVEALLRARAAATA